MASAAQAASRIAPRSAHPRGVSDPGLLVRRIADADEAALAELYAVWAGQVRTLARRIVRDEEDAEEVVGSTFWYVWRNARRFDPARGGVGAWMASVARSRAWDCLRARGGRARGPRRTQVPLSESAAPELRLPGPDEEYEAQERRERVRQAIRGLPQAQREVMELAYCVGMSHAQIARSTRLPLGTVKTRVRLATVRLRGPLSRLG